MARSVSISTPVPSLEEFGNSLGLSKTRQKSLLNLVRRNDGELSSRRGDVSTSGLSSRHRNESTSAKSKLTVVKK